MSNNLLLKDNKLISSSDVLYKWSAGNKLARAYSTDVWNKPLVGGRLSEIGLYPRVFDTYKWLVDNNLYDKLVFGINRQAGFLPNEITGADHLHTAYDLSKYENDAIQATPADQPKILSKAWEFDGGSNYAKIYSDLGDSIIGSTGFWIKAPYPSTIETIMTSVPEISAPRLYIGLNTNGTIKFYRKTVKNSTGAVGDNVWTYVVLIYSDTNVSYYFNGVFDKTDTWSGLLDTQTEFYIGYGFDGYLGGQISDILIYNQALTPEQITSYYNETQNFYK